VASTRGVASCFNAINGKHLKPAPGEVPRRLENESRLARDSSKSAELTSGRVDRQDAGGTADEPL